jgi:hypothetical protein
VLAKAGELQQNPNRFVNLCVEGILDAMDAVGVYEIPILQLYRTLKGKPLPTFKTILILCSVLAPEFSRMDVHERKLLFGLMDKHDGRMTLGMFKDYCGLAVRMNKQRLEHERRLSGLLRLRDSH